MFIYLRPVRLEDGPQIVRWRNDESVLSHCMSKSKITVESNKLFYENYILTGKYKQYIVEYVESYSGAIVYPIATVYLKDMDYENKRCELCIFTSNDVEWVNESQIFAIQQLVFKAFSEFGMHKVYSYVFPKFPEEVELLKLAGFQEEVLLKEEVLLQEGCYEDLLRMSIINNIKI